jgi:2-polyprenyl-3-methyl-5-hydroxy-6-metoxy-1,4-benzoquinol methylase
LAVAHPEKPLNPEYGERYRELYEKHWWWRARTEFIIQTLRRIVPRNERQSILDIGCGDALFFPRLREFGEVEGVEPFTDLLNPTNPDRSHIYACPFDQNFKPGKQYSLILMLDVLEHLAEPLGALRCVRDLLQPNGALLVTVPAFMALWTNHDIINHHFTRYTKSRLRTMTEEAGLRVTDARYLYHWTFPAKIALGIAERTLRLQPTPARVPVWWINRTLFWLSRLEQKTVSRLPMPLGSSLMAIVKQAGTSLTERATPHH